PGPRPERVPLSLAQQRMWFLHRFDPASTAYHIVIALRLSGPLDAGALSMALADVMSRHEILRTVYPEHDGVPYQQVLAPEQVAAPDMAPIPVESSAVADHVDRIGAAAYDLTSRVPVRAALLRQGDDEHVLVVAVHHIAADGFSLRPLARDIAAA